MPYTSLQPTRRAFLKQAGAAALLCSTTSTLPLLNNEKTHFITLSFDDGFRKSSLKTAEIFEKHNLSACINVIATAHYTDFELPNEYHDWPVGDFGLWNELMQRGHEIMPHGYMHKNLKEAPFDVAKDLILRSLNYFSKELKGFEPKEAVFNFPFNASSPEIEAWLFEQVKAFRTGGDPFNPLPYDGQSKLTCTSFGPGNIDEHLTGTIDRLLARPSGWLIYNTHGLDEEGWGPLTASVLDGLLSKLTAVDSVEIVPAGVALSGQLTPEP